VIAQRSAESGETFAEGPTSLSIGRYEMPLPTKLQSISFGESHRDTRLQIADVVAGASAYVAAVAWGLRPLDQFARELGELGLRDLVQWWVGPDFDPRLFAKLS
jgi:hypothetical protein